jgi:glycosyltransferase involved in cell wall biosynthesis
MLKNNKIVFVTNLARKIGAFSTNSINASKRICSDFYIFANWQDTDIETILAYEKQYGITIKNSPISRNPFSKSNFTAYNELVELIKQENIDYIHCNTPTGGILGRLAGKKCKVKKVIYQAHGFHFYKGAPKKNWLIYYPIEKLLARYTDAIITINKEDYELAKEKLKLRNGGKVYYVPGVGIDAAQYLSNTPVNNDKRKELNIPDDAFVIISVGELNKNKNNKVIISALKQLDNKNIHYVVCGIGEKEAELQAQVNEAGLADNVHFVGYRNDVNELYKIADCFTMTSLREGLPRSVMEAMASGLPCIVSKIRGNVDLIDECQGGYLCDPTDAAGFAKAINKLCSDSDLREKMGQYNLDKIKNFDISVVEKAMADIYAEVFERK